VPNTSSPVNNKEQFCTVVRSKLGNHRLLFAGETDCIDSSKHFVELKTQHEFDTARQKENFLRFKSLKWWIQSFLVGIDKIIVGYRDDNGFVRRVEPMPVPHLLTKSKDYWHGNVAFNFLHAVLTFLSHMLTENDSTAVYLLDWRPSWPTVNLKPLPIGNRGQFDFLPSDFIDLYDH